MTLKAFSFIHVFEQSWTYFIFYIPVCKPFEPVSCLLRLSPSADTPQTCFLARRPDWEIEPTQQNRKWFQGRFVADKVRIFCLVCYTVRSIPFYVFVRFRLLTSHNRRKFCVFKSPASFIFINKAGCSEWNFTLTTSLSITAGRSCLHTDELEIKATNYNWWIQTYLSKDNYCKYSSQSNFRVSTCLL